MNFDIHISGSNPLEGLAMLAAAGTYCLSIPAVSTAAHAMLETASGTMNTSISASPAPASGAVPTPGFIPAQVVPPSPATPAQPPATTPPSAPAQPPAPTPRPAPAGMFPTYPQNPASGNTPAGSLPGGAQNPMTRTAPSDQNPQQVIPGMGSAVPTSGPGAGSLPVSRAPSFTVEQISKAGADLVTANPAKREDLKALFQLFGVQSMTELKPEQLGQFAMSLRGLGASI